MAQQRPLILKNGIWQQMDDTDTIKPANLGTGTRDGSKFLRDDGTWQAPSGGVSDGDKGDIVVSDSGATWTLKDAFKKSHAINAYAALGSSIKAEPISGNITNITGSASLNIQRMFLIATDVRISQTFTGLKWWQSSQGNYVANNYNGVGLYSYSGGTLTLVASSSDDGNIWKGSSNSWQSKAFSSTYAATAGIYFMAFVWNASSTTTAPAIGIMPNITNANILAADFTNSAKLWGIVNATTTALPSTQAMTGVSTNNLNIYTGLY